MGVAEQTIEKMDAFFFFDERKIRERRKSARADNFAVR
jgi:hypothetical protein